MIAYRAFVGKEFLASLRTFRLFIMGAVFLFLGILSPLTAQLLPLMMDAMATEGFEMTMSDPTAIDAWTQFFSNVGQLGSLTVIIVFCGTMAGELSKGTLINMLTKGLHRSTVILAKLTVAVILWTGVYGLCLGVTYAYTAYCWPMVGMHHTMLSFFSLWLFGVWLITLCILGGVLFKKTIGSLMMAFGAMLLLSTANIFPKLYKFNPINLGGSNILLLSGQKAASEFIPAVVICAVLCVGLTALAVAVFDKRGL